MYLKGWLTWITNCTTSRKVYVKHLGYTLMGWTQSSQRAARHPGASDRPEKPDKVSRRGREGCKLQWTSIIIRWNSKLLSHFTLQEASKAPSVRELVLFFKLNLLCIECCSKSSSSVSCLQHSMMTCISVAHIFYIMPQSYLGVLFGHFVVLFCPLSPWTFQRPVYFLLKIFFATSFSPQIHGKKLDLLTLEGIVILNIGR